MQKLLVPAVLALALATGGAAFAGSAAQDIDLSLYEESTPDAVMYGAPGTDAEHARTLDSESQRASTAPMTATGWEKPAGKSVQRDYGPE